MTQRLIVARRMPRRVRFSVWLDTTKVVDVPAPGTPDPLWVITEDYPLGRGERRQPGEAAGAYTTRITAYLANIRADMHARADTRLAELVDETDPGVALAGEGQDF